MTANLRIKPLLKGLLTNVPALQKLVHRQGTGGSCDASYCYGVWMKHLVMLWAAGQQIIPEVVAELGPGDSLGLGFAALLSGAERFIALDVEAYANTPASNLAMFDALVLLFQARAPRPTKGWPDFDSHLDDRLFPSHILTEERLNTALAPERLARIRNTIANLGQGSKDPNAEVRYVVPWDSASVVEAGAVDLICSQSVLEHVNDLPPTYRAFHTWLKPGGCFSQQVDFSSHGLANYWNGHWGFSEFMWKLMKGRRTFLLNRKPYSTHIKLAQENGFDVFTQLRHQRSDGLKREQLAEIATGFTEDDATTDSLFFQGRRI
jgi:hypothetical protein